MLFLRCALYCAATLALSACAPQVPRFMVQVDALTSPQAAQHTSYVLEVNNAQTEPPQAPIPAVLADTNRTLIAHGFVPAQNADQATLRIELSYGVSAPQTETIIRDRPIEGKTGALASSTTVTSISPSGETTTTTSYKPAYGVIGYRQETELRTSYTSYAVLAAFDTKEKSAKGKPIEIWRIAMRQTSGLNDLQRIFPVMLAAAAPYIGASTGKRIEVILNEDGASILMVKGLPIPDKDEKKEGEKVKK